VVRAHPELFAGAAALRLELPGRSAAQIASILYHRGMAASPFDHQGAPCADGKHHRTRAARGAEDA
jgi:hypothetical protein